MLSRRSSTFLCEADERHRNRELYVFFPSPQKGFALFPGAGDSTTSGKNSNNLKPYRTCYGREPCLVGRPPNGHAPCPPVESDGQLLLVVNVFFLLSFFFSC